jgi:hypothetical protein
MLLREGADQEHTDEDRLVLHGKAYTEEEWHWDTENDQVG